MIVVKHYNVLARPVIVSTQLSHAVLLSEEEGVILHLGQCEEFPAKVMVLCKVGLKLFRSVK